MLGTERSLRRTVCQWFWLSLGLRFGLVAGLAPLLSGCTGTLDSSQNGHDEGGVRSSNQAVSEAAAPAAVVATATTLPTVTVTLPPGGTVQTTPIAANGTLVLKDRASVKSAAGAHLPLQNLGATSTDIGVGTTTAALTSKASVLLRNNARVQGNLRTGGTLTKQAGATVTGTTTQRATLPAPVTKTWTVPLTSTPSAPQTVPEYGSLTLAPGSYGKLAALSFSTVTVTPGIYAFSDLQLEADSTLHLNLSGTTGPVVLYLDAFSAFRGKVTTTGPDPATKLLIVHRGTAKVRIEKSAPMALVAPNATVELATGGVTHRGSVFAKGISLDPDVKMVYVPFAHWDWLEPVTPYVSCVLPTGRGTYAAAFGYTSLATTPVNVPVGPQNGIAPVPIAPVAPLTQFLAGTHDKTLWLPMTTSASWTLLGRTALANLASPPCELPESTGLPDTIAAEGRPRPRPNLPSAPAPRRSPSAGKNASGPGQFAGRPRTAALGVGGGVSPPPVSDPLVPAEAGMAPNIPDGVQFTPTNVVDHNSLELRFHAVTVVPNEGWPEGTNLWAETITQGQSPLSVQLETPNNVASFSQTFVVQGATPLNYYFREIEFNDHSDHESYVLNLTLDPATGGYAATQESGRIVKQWVFGLPLSLTEYSVHNSTETTGQLGDLRVFDFEGDNQVSWSLAATGNPVLTAVPFDATTRVAVCANWTGYFVDEGLSLQDGITEQFTGKHLDDGLRVRGYRASYARYELATKGLAGSHKQSGFLDHDGCVPGGVATAALAYSKDVTDGSAGGVSLYLRVEGALTNREPVGSAFIIYEPIQGENVVVTKEFQYTRFDDQPGWTEANGLMLPPAEVELTREHRDGGSTAAAIVSHVLRRLHDENVALWPEVVDVLTGTGNVGLGTRDYQGNDVPNSNAYEHAEIGPAFFPCADLDAEPTATSPCARKVCAADSDCPGGQHCAKKDDAGDGCEGGECYCAYAEDSSNKYIITHELGHLMQRGLLGGVLTSGGYAFSCPNGNCEATNGQSVYGRISSQESTEVVDPPFMDPVCGCRHVKAANGEHCIQSIEHISMAHLEGFGHFFSSFIWNAPSQPNCRFNYYKEVLDVGADSCRHRLADGSRDQDACSDYAITNPLDGTVTPAAISLPPITFDCDEAFKWRNNNRCAVDSSVEPIGKSTMGTELDWMAFLYAVSRQVGFNEVMGLHKAACRRTGDINRPCVVQTGLDSEGRPIWDVGDPMSWVDGLLGGNIDTESGQVVNQRQHGGFLSGAQRKYGGALDPRAVLIGTTGDAHGVSDNTSPLP
jgi:hypothetical protein